MGLFSMFFITLIILEAAIFKEKAEPTPVKKGLIYYVHNHITMFPSRILYHAILSLLFALNVILWIC